MTTLHVLGLSHTQTTAEYQVCAFTQKTIKFCKMMRAQGYKVILYSGEDNEADVDEHVVVVTKAQQQQWYGKVDPNNSPNVGSFDANAQPWIHMNSSIIVEIGKRIQEGDIICLTQGLTHKPVADAFPSNLAVESGVGYAGVFSNFCCFESYAWMHFLYADQLHINEGRMYDAVIPNFFEKEQFPFQAEPEDYLLFVGRLIKNKGLEIAVEIAKRAGKQLYIAGPGAQEWDAKRHTLKGINVGVKGKHIQYVGVLNAEQRGEAMSKALAVIAPTIYIEPFGGVAVEAMMCGTPAITTDFGAYPETVIDGTTGFRIRTIAEGVQAVENLDSLVRKTIRSKTQNRYSLEAVGPQYDRWFENLDTLSEDGFYT